MLKPEDTAIPTLGPRQVPSPLTLAADVNQGVSGFVSDEARVRLQIELFTGQDLPENIRFEKAGPREQIFFRPDQTRAAVVTCGGLCPGLNNVIRSVFLELYHNYGVQDVLGIRHGFQGLNPAVGKLPVPLTVAAISQIEELGGTILGSSRGPQDPAVMVDFLEKERINLLLCVGGDGTQRGSHAIHQEIQRRGVPIAVVGVPKTIDNDIQYMTRTFGFATAIEQARHVLECAHVEALAAENGIGLVKLMGRESGFIAAFATVASQEVNFTLIPEVPFELEGENGFLAALRKRLQSKSHAVVVVAEGAGQHLMKTKPTDKDASGNLKLGDIGVFLKERIVEYFQREKIPVQLKYIDPSYVIRSVPANCDDSLLCDQLARNAVHAGMAGKTDVLIGLWNGRFIHLPIPLATAEKQRVSPHGEVWRSVLASTGQPHVFK